MSLSTLKPSSASKHLPPATEVKQAHLLGIPPELRNRIYSYLLESPRAFQIETRRSGKLWMRQCCYPAILATCRLIRQEATPMHYGENKYVLFEDSINLFPDMIGANIQFIRHMRLVRGGWDLTTFGLEKFHRATGLVELGVEVADDRMQELMDDAWYDSDAQEGKNEYYVQKADGEANDFASSVYNWVMAQRTAPRGSHKTDPLDVLRVWSHDGQKKLPRDIAKRLAWKLEKIDRASLGYEQECLHADADEKKKLDEVQERAEKLELVLLEKWEKNHE